MAKNPHSHRSFEIIYKNLALPITKFVMKHMGAQETQVEEVVQETFVAAWKGWHTFRHKSSYFTWLCRISLNKIADYYHDQVNRNSRIIVPFIEALTETDSKSLSPEEHLALKDLRKSVNNCLDLMSPEKRKYLQFRYWYDLSYSEIAKIMGVSERAVEGQIYRAKEEFVRVWSSKEKKY